MKKLQLNKKSIMGLSFDGKKLSQQEQKRFAGGKPKIETKENKYSWGCCMTSENCTFSC